MFHVGFLPPSFPLSFFLSIPYSPVKGNSPLPEKKVFFSTASIRVFDFASIEGIKYKKDLWGCQEDIIQPLKSPLRFKKQSF
jgi:hypothetical protein